MSADESEEYETGGEPDADETVGVPDGLRGLRDGIGQGQGQSSAFAQPSPSRR